MTKAFPRERWQALASAGLKAVGLSAHVKSVEKLQAHVGDILKRIEFWEPRPEHMHDWAGHVDTRLSQLSVYFKN